MALKLSLVVPIFKNKGFSFEAGNYRPISLLSSVEKIVEKLVPKRKMKYLDQNNVLYDNPLCISGRNGFSTSFDNMTIDIQFLSSNNIVSAPG